MGWREIFSGFLPFRIFVDMSAKHIQVDPVRDTKSRGHLV